MSSLKIVVFPGPEGVAYTTEKRAVPTNPMVGFLSEHSSTRTQEQITIEPITHDKRKTTRIHGRQLVCPPILDLAMNKRWQQHPAHKHRRIVNGFFPSKIRTSTNNGAVKDATKDNQEAFDEVFTVDPASQPHQNGACLSRTGSKHGQLSPEPAVWRTSGQQHEEKVYSGRRVPLSLRNGSPSPWINRYQLKKKSISACNKGELMSSQSVTRGFSR